jgi:hypothetical protein
MEPQLERIEAALGSMSLLGPRALAAYLRKPTPDFPDASVREVAGLIDLLLADDPNHPARLRFSGLIREWDNLKDPDWSAGTSRNTEERRELIHQLLQTDSPLMVRIDSLIPFYRLEEPLVIAETHTDWYDPKTGLHDYYWQTYKAYLKEKKVWQDRSLMGLDNDTRAILECLSNPESVDAYASRGLVMGYVQSGKTANFAGVIARAADAGYRLVIVLAGTWNILRNQTQRRLDKELLGKELLQNDESYQDSPPRDWGEFLEHGFDPTQRGLYGWQRLTRPDIDFKSLKSAIDNLEFERREKALPLYHPSNLHALPAKLLVVKKNKGILKKLVKDLKLLRTKLTDLPALIIDDESDQAGLNTADPRLRKGEDKERSKTNEAIVELLGLFPRGQYVGYTATPYANALVDPDDPEDLFPKDFIVSLDRPIGYMGVLDFFDPEADFADLDPSDYSLKEIAFIRRVNNPQGADDDELQQALRSYVLSGALKLYRQSKAPRHYSFRHHTMLIHTSSSTSSQNDLADRVIRLWNKCAFNSPTGMDALEELWNKDFTKVSNEQAPAELSAEKFSELIPHLAETIELIEKGSRCVMVVNYTSKEAPDFGEEPVWKIIIGGNKLSRGYTVEGLTVSYYRRVASTADTLMQMGRWFGFRQGYQDLVRVFLGVREGKKGNVDLVAMFKQVCLMEERFRKEITRYARTPSQSRITPKQIPPLISVIGQLPPTSRNKMFNAVIENRNYGGRWSQPTLIATSGGGIRKNTEVFQRLLSESRSQKQMVLGGKAASANKSRNVSANSWVFESTTKDIIAFLTDYQWQESRYKYPARPADIELQIEFLRKQNNGIASWLVIAPQRQTSYGSPFRLDGVVELTAKERRRLESGVFQNFGEPAHRVIAEFLAGVQKESEKENLVEPNAKTVELANSHQGIVLAYPVRENKTEALSIGFEMLFPKNNLGFNVNFTVRKKSELGSVIVSP